MGEGLRRERKPGQGPSVKLIKMSAKYVQLLVREMDGLTVFGNRNWNRKSDSESGLTLFGPCLVLPACLPVRDPEAEANKKKRESGVCPKQ